MYMFTCSYIDLQQVKDSLLQSLCDGMYMFTCTYRDSSAGQGQSPTATMRWYVHVYLLLQMTFSRSRKSFRSLSSLGSSFTVMHPNIAQLVTILLQLHLAIFRHLQQADRGTRRKFGLTTCVLQSLNLFVLDVIQVKHFLIFARVL